MVDEGQNPIIDTTGGFEIDRAHLGPALVAGEFVGLLAAVVAAVLGVSLVGLVVVVIVVPLVVAALILLVRGLRADSGGSDIPR